MFFAVSLVTSGEQLMTVIAVASSGASMSLAAKQSPSRTHAARIKAKCMQNGSQLSAEILLDQVLSFTACPPATLHETLAPAQRRQGLPAGAPAGCRTAACTGPLLQPGARALLW